MRQSAECTSVQINPAFRCICGHALTGHDFDIDETRIRLICNRCHRQLIAIDIINDDDGEEYDE
jgi:hypothetical protein